MRRFKAKAGATIWNDEGYWNIRQGAIVRVEVGKAGLLAVPAVFGGKHGLVSIEDLQDFPSQSVRKVAKPSGA
jgi:hypothetical protein